MSDERPNGEARNPAGWDRICLITCGGRQAEAPSAGDMRDALEEVFSGCHAGEARLQCDAADDTVCVVTVNADGTAMATRYADDSMSQQLSRRQWQGLDRKAALALWRKIVAGEVAVPGLATA